MAGAGPEPLVSAGFRPDQVVRPSSGLCLVCCGLAPCAKARAGAQVWVGAQCLGGAQASWRARVPLEAGVAPLPPRPPARLECGDNLKLAAGTHLRARRRPSACGAPRHGDHGLNEVHARGGAERKQLRAILAHKLGGSAARPRQLGEPLVRPGVLKQEAAARRDTRRLLEGAPTRTGRRPLGLSHLPHFGAARASCQAGPMRRRGPVCMSVMYSGVAWISCRPGVGCGQRDEPVGDSGTSAASRSVAPMIELTRAGSFIRLFV